MPQFIVVLVIIALLVAFLASSIKIIHQQKIGLVERLGKFNRRLTPGPHLVIPIIDRVQYNLDMREQVVPFPPQGVITEDNLMVNIDSVIYFQIVDPERAAYEAQSYKTAIEQLTMTTLRNIIGGMDMEAALTSREEINQKLRSVLDEATGKWGIKVNRVELRAIEPPPTIRDAMEKGARAERDKRAAILLAEGQRQSQILSAGGDRESAILRAQGDREAAVLRAQADRQAQMLRAEGEAQAITTVFNAIHAGQPDQGLLAYQYMQMLPTLAPTRSGSYRPSSMTPSRGWDRWPAVHLRGPTRAGSRSPIRAGSPRRRRLTSSPRLRLRRLRRRRLPRPPSNRPFRKLPSWRIRGCQANVTGSRARFLAPRPLSRLKLSPSRLLLIRGDRELLETRLINRPTPSTSVISILEGSGLHRISEVVGPGP